MNGSNGCQTSLATRSFDRILIVKPSSLGDLVHTLPLLHGLRVRYPRAVISWLIADAFAPLLANHPELDEVIRFDRRLYGMVGRSLKPSVAFLEFIRSLRARRFDLAIDVQGLFRSGFLTMGSGAAVRLGLASAREMASIFYTHRVRDDEPDLHAAERNYLVGRTLGFADVPMAFDLAVTDLERQAASRLLADAGLARGAPFVAVLPGARWETKRWPASRFAALIDRVWNDQGVTSVLLSSPAERHLCASVADEAASHPVDLSGRTGIRESVAILERASVVVSHDSAPMHIAAALGRPLVAILGPTNPRRTGPYGEPASVVRANVACAPCYVKTHAQCRYDHQCMKAVDVACVARKVSSQLAGSIRDAPSPRDPQAGVPRAGAAFHK